MARGPQRAGIAGDTRVTTRVQAVMKKYKGIWSSYGTPEAVRPQCSLSDSSQLSSTEYYYSYESTETSSLSSRSPSKINSSGKAASRTSPSESSTTGSPPKTANVDSASSNGTPAEPLGSPILAPDCSACGMRLDYMRYVCHDCGEGEMWRKNASEKAAFGPPRVPSFSELSQGSSEVTEWAAQAGPSGSPAVRSKLRPRNGSHSTNASHSTLHIGNVVASSPTGAIYHSHSSSGPTPPDSPRSGPVHLFGDMTSRGYELCPGCIEVHGISHARAVGRTKRKIGTKQSGVNGVQHAFREKIWGTEGWVDVGECFTCTTT